MIKGDKVLLTADIPTMARYWRNQYTIWRWCRQNTLISVDEHLNWLEKIKSDKTIKMFGIKSGIEPFHDVGVCGLTSIDKHNQTAEFSLYISPLEQKNGYGRDALKTLCNHGFFHMNLNRIWGETFDENPAIKMFESLGFKKEGTLRQSYFREGNYIDSHIFSAIRSEWRCKPF